MPTTSWSHIPYPVRQRITTLIFTRDLHRCQIRGPRCTGQAQEVDHIRPIHDGGNPLDTGNMRAACRRCNRAGGAAITNRTTQPTRRTWYG